jgi:hypothetical protein
MKKKEGGALARKRPRVQGVSASAKESITTKLTRESMDFVVAEAAKLGISRTAIIEMALRFYAKSLGKTRD